MSTPGNSQTAAGWFPTADITAAGGAPPPPAPMQGLPRGDGLPGDQGPYAGTFPVPPPDAVPTGEPLPGRPSPDELPPDDLLLDPAWERPAIRNRLTSVLLIAVLVVGGFAGGIAVQRQRGGTGTTTGGLPTAGRLPGGLPGGGAFPGGGGFPGGAPSLPGGGSGAAANGSGASTNPLGGGSAGAGAASAPVVVGRVTSIRSASITVRNFAGKNVTVQVPGTAKVTTSGLAGLAAGATVAVAGTTAADGTVTATAITVTAST